MRLVTPSVQWRSAFLEMARECEAAGEHRYALALRDFESYLQKIEAARPGHNLPDGWVPGTEFWLEDSGQIIASARLRLALTPDLENEGGHVGYDVRPSMRRAPRARCSPGVGRGAHSESRESESPAMTTTSGRSR
jgi:predicted acetyltransferase